MAIQVYRKARTGETFQTEARKRVAGQAFVMPDLVSVEQAEAVWLQLCSAMRGVESQLRKHKAAGGEYNEWVGSAKGTIKHLRIHLAHTKERLRALREQEVLARRAVLSPQHDKDPDRAAIRAAYNLLVQLHKDGVDFGQDGRVVIDMLRDRLL